MNSIVSRIGKLGKSFKPLDYLIVIIFAAISILVSFKAYTNGTGQKIVRIESDGGVQEYDASVAREIKVAGPLGDTIIHIEGNEAWVVDSPCRDKICVHAGHITEANDWAACLPNRVFLSFAISEENDIHEDSLDAQTW